MKNEMMVFKGKEVEIFEHEGQVLFNTKDVGVCLGIKNINDNITRMNERQVIKLKNSDIGLTDFRKLNNAGENFLTESGVYKLIFKSKKKEAEEFQDWVTDVVLPSIRQNGGYISKNATAKQVETLNKKWLEKSKYLTEEIHDRKSIRKYIREYDKMKIDECINTIAEMTSKIKGEVKHELLDVSIKELKKIDDELQFDNNKHTYIKNTCKDGIVILQDVKIGKYKRRIITLEQ